MAKSAKRNESFLLMFSYNTHVWPHIIESEQVGQTALSFQEDVSGTEI